MMFSLSTTRNEETFLKRVSSSSSKISNSVPDFNNEEMVKSSVARQAIHQSFIENLDVIKSNGKGFGSVNPVKGVIDPTEVSTRSMIGLKGSRKRIATVDFKILREISRRVGVIRAIQNVRKMQIRPFATISYNDDDIGFRVRLKDKKAVTDSYDEKMIYEIEQFFLHMGYNNFPGANEREEGMLQAIEMLTSDMMTIDQVAISLRRNKAGKIIDMWLLDPEFIKRTSAKGFEGDKKIKFVQEIDGKVVETFTEDDLLFYCNNQSSELMNRGYGYSYIEQCLDLITGWLFAMSYNKEYFNSNSMPRGFLSFAGTNLDQPELEELQRQWISMFRGIKGVWRTPFLQHDAKYVSLQQSNLDMQWNEYTQILASWICAVHGIDPAEMGIRLNNSQKTMYENPETKIVYSSDRGLKELVIFHQTWMNRLIDKVPEWEKYRIEFTGLEKKNQQQAIDIDEKQTQVYLTINEKRKEKDLPPIKGGDIIANPSFIQLIAQQQQLEGMQGMTGASEAESATQEADLTPEEEDELKNASDEDIQEAVDKTSVTKSFKEKKMFSRNNDYIEIDL